jgi:hypothetical protein
MLESASPRETTTCKQEIDVVVLCSAQGSWSTQSAWPVPLPARCWPPACLTARWHSLPGVYTKRNRTLHSLQVLRGGVNLLDEVDALEAAAEQQAAVLEQERATAAAAAARAAELEQLTRGLEVQYSSVQVRDGAVQQRWMTVVKGVGRPGSLQTLQPGRCLGAQGSSQGHSL